MKPILAHTEGGAHASGCGASSRSPSGGSEARSAEAKQERQQPAPQGALGNTRVEFPRLDERRLMRFERRAKSARIVTAEHLQSTGERLISPFEAVNITTGELRKVSKEEARTLLPPRIARCSWALGSAVTLHGSSETPAHYSGTERCGSVSACPVCAPVIRNTRAQEITQAVEKHQAQGGHLLFVTLTIRHTQKHSLEESISAVLGSWQSLLRGRAWGTFKEEHQISGYLRSLEITRGESGWHPHIHALFFLEKSLSPAEIATFEKTMFSRWSALASKKNGDFAPTPEHGIDCQQVDRSGKVLAKYLAKIQEEKRVSWGVGPEMTRGDLKDARKKSRTPFELIEDGEAQLWLEYVRATKGRRILTWSLGLKDRFEIEEKDDNQIIEETEESPLTWEVSRSTYENARKNYPLILAYALDAVEAENLDLLAELLPGTAPPPDSGAKPPKRSV